MQKSRLPGSKKRIGMPVIMLVLMLILNTGHKQDQHRFRPRTPWAFRSVLDLKPRMLTLALDSVLYVAYDLSNASLYKVWKGGVSLDGAVYTSKKDIQPSSWGAAYFIDSTSNYEYKAERAGKEIPLRIENKGYVFRDDQIFLKHLVILNNKDSVSIEERPEFVRNKNGQPGLERLFKIHHLPEAVQISIVSKDTAFILKEKEETKWTTYYKELPEQFPPKTQTESLPPYKLVLQKSDCLICHEIEEPAVGPSFRQIAERYPKEKTAFGFLLNKIKQGGTGSWGNGVMNPHPLLTDAEISTVLDYIFTLKPKGTASQTERLRAENRTRPARPGFGAALSAIHPSYDLTTLHNENFKPKVGGMAFMPDGTLLITTWDTLGGVYAIEGLKSNDPVKIKPRLIASGLAEPLGIEVVNGEIFVLQKQELTKLIDLDKDGIIDEYRAVCNTWQVSPDFHEFAFGLVYKEGYFYVGLSMAMRLKPGELQLQDRGRVIKIAPNGSYEWVNYGLRTPNGIGLGIDNEIFLTDNQGQWLPGNKLIHVKSGQNYYGMGWGLLGSKVTPAVTPPAIWLPQNEIGNSPTEPVLMKDGPYKGQMLHGDMGHGGIKRDFLEKVKGEYQGAVFRFSQGFEAGVNRMRWGPDGALYVGQIGMTGGGWSWKDRLYGLQKIKYNGKSTFEMLAIRAKPKGFEIEFTQPIGAGFELKELTIQQWWYEPTPAYGGPKKDQTDLKVSKMQISTDRKRVYLEIRGLKKRNVIYFRLPDDLKSKGGNALWSSEAWYTLNEIPF